MCVLGPILIWLPMALYRSGWITGAGNRPALNMIGECSKKTRSSQKSITLFQKYAGYYRSICNRITSQLPSCHDDADEDVEKYYRVVASSYFAPANFSFFKSHNRAGYSSRRRSLYALWRKYFISWAPCPASSTLSMRTTGKSIVFR